MQHNFARPKYARGPEGITKTLQECKSAVTGGSIHRTIHTQIYGNFGIFPENAPICQGKFGVAADSQRRRNNVH